MTYIDRKEGKESACNTGDPDLIPRLERSPGEGNGYSLQNTGLENSMDVGAWQDTVHGVKKKLCSDTTEPLLLVSSGWIDEIIYRLCHS